MHQVDRHEAAAGTAEGRKRKRGNFVLVVVKHANDIMKKGELLITSYNQNYRSLAYQRDETPSTGEWVVSDGGVWEKNVKGILREAAGC